MLYDRIVTNKFSTNGTNIICEAQKCDNFKFDKYADNHLNNMEGVHLSSNIYHYIVTGQGIRLLTHDICYSS